MTLARTLGLTVAGGALAGGALYYGGSGAPASSGPISVAVQAAPREVDEGDLVEFVATVTQSEEEGFAFHHFRWEYGDGSPGTEGQDLSDVRHRFADDGSFRVAVQAGDAEASVSVRVRNVAPTIRSFSTLVPARPGDPVTFEVTATDPGLRDRLSYVWNFGDQTEQRGTSSTITHRYDTPGFYTAEVVVDDGDGGVDRGTVQVLAHAAFGVNLSGEVNAAIAGGGNDRPRASLRYQQPLRTADTSLFTDGAPATATANREGCFLAVQMAASDARGQHVFAIGLDVYDSALVPGEYPVAPEANIWPACGTPGMRCPARHDAVNGSVILTRVGPDGVEGRADLSTEFSPGAQTRMTAAFASGPVQQGDPRCTIESTVETFDLASSTPAAEAQNVDPGNPRVELTFTHPVNPATIAGNVLLQYGRAGGMFPLDYHVVPGAWELVPGDDHSIRFVPQARLLDGVVHCVWVRPGREGLRGRRGEVLALGHSQTWTDPVTDRFYDACYTFQPWNNAGHGWSFSTVVDLESVLLHVYQSTVVLPRDASQAPSSWLVAGKPSVARVYPHWTAKDSQAANAPHADSQVKSFPARVSVRLGDRLIAAPRRTDIRRPDQFDADDRKHARNSVNLFGWRPTAQRGNAELRAVIEAIDETGATVQTFESAVQRLPYWHDSPVLSFDYHILKVNGCAGPLLEPCEDWRETVPAAARAHAHALAASGAVFTTQNFPVVETRGRPMEDLHISEPLQVRDVGLCERDPSLRRFYCYNPGVPELEHAVHQHVARQFYAAAGGSTADIIVGIVPPGFATHWLGMQYDAPDINLRRLVRTVRERLGLGNDVDLPRRYVLAELNSLNAAGVAHEFGHFFEFDHCPENPDDLGANDEECRAPRIVGFRVSPSGARGFNKFDAEGNQEADKLVPLMHYGQHPVAETFIAASNYGDLFDRLARVRRRPTGSLVGVRRPWPALVQLLVPRPVFAQSPDGATDGRVIVRGTVTNDRVVLHQVQHRPGAAPPSRTSGEMALQLVDVAGRVLQSIPFSPDAPDAWHAGPADPAVFSLDVAAPVGLHTVRVAAPGGTSARHSRSARPPTIRAEVTSVEAPATRTLRWAAGDPDGDDVRVDVYVRADDEGPWRGVAIGTDRTSLTLDAGTLPTGRRAAARLVASDGFNTASTEIDLGPGAPLTVLATHPRADETDVSASAEVMVFLSAPLPAAGSAPASTVDARWLRMTGPDGETVFADVASRPAAGRLILTPLQPLRPGTRYTVTVAAGLEDARGGRLTSDVVWSFVTAPSPPGR
jgi:hypothetical protein